MPENVKRYWKVPPTLYAALDAEFHFDFDPCPYPKPDGWDGLSQDWGKSNFVNPPFKASDGGPIGKWIVKSIEQWKKGKTVVLLVTSDTSTKWFAGLRLLEQAGNAELRFIQGRVRFLEVEDGTPGPNPMMGALLAILRPPHNPCDGCKHKPGKYFGRCCHCSRNPKATEDYYELEAKYETCAHGFVMQINDGDGYPLSKDRGCDVGKIAVDECDCPVDCPDYKLRQVSEKSAVKCRWCGLELPPAYCVHEWVMCPNPKCGMDILPLSPEVEGLPEEDESP